MAKNKIIKYIFDKPNLIILNAILTNVAMLGLALTVSIALMVVFGGITQFSQEFIDATPYLLATFVTSALYLFYSSRRTKKRRK